MGGTLRFRCRNFLRSSLWLAAVGSMAAAEAQDLQLYPDFDSHLRLNFVLRSNFQAYGVREVGDPVQFQAGPSIQFHLKPFIKTQRPSEISLNGSRSKFLVLEAGYRYLATPHVQAVAASCWLRPRTFPCQFGCSSQTETGWTWTG